MARYEIQAKLKDPGMLQHRFPMPDEAAKFATQCLADGLDPKKTSNVEDSWYRNGSGAFIPPEHVKGAILDGCKGVKVPGSGNATFTRAVKSGLMVSPCEILLNCEKYDSVHACYVKVGTARVLRERPLFKAGREFTFEVEAEASEIDEAHVKRFIEKAGRIGLGDWRPASGGAFGTFSVELFKRVD